jgi:hypothetical protein
VDISTRRKKQQAMMTELLERKIRLHAQNLYDQRGEAEGSELEDWVRAESQVLEKSILAPLYRKTKAASQESDGFEENSNSQPHPTDSIACEACS